MSTLPDPQKKRLREIINASLSKRLEGVKDLGRADVDLLVARVEELELDDRAPAEELMKWALARLKEERDHARGWLEDALEQVRIAELCLMESEHSVEAVQALVDGGMFVSGDEINKRWSAVEEDYRARGMLPAQPEPEIEPVEAPKASTPPKLEPEAELPAALVKQLSKKAQAAHAERPAPAPAAAIPAQRQPGALSTTRPGDPLTEIQEKVFRAIASAADAEWRAQISQGRMAALSGVKPGGLSTHVDALERKDYIRILDRGNSHSAGTYWICERARPDRAAPPKTDAELIAEALAAGRVTKVPPPGSVGVH